MSAASGPATAAKSSRVREGSSRLTAALAAWVRTRAFSAIDAERHAGVGLPRDRPDDFVQGDQMPSGSELGSRNGFGRQK